MISGWSKKIISLAKVGYWTVVPESTRAMFYFTGIYRCSRTIETMRVRKHFCDRSEKRFLYPWAREPDWSMKKIGCDSLSLSFFANWTTISFKLDEYWQSVGNTGWLSLCAACFAKPRVPNGGRCTPEKPIENFSVIEGGDFDKFRYELRELKRKENEKKSRCTLTALSSPPLCPSKKKKKLPKSFQLYGFQIFLFVSLFPYE